MSAKYKSPSFLLPNELNTSANTANDTGVNSLYSMDIPSATPNIITVDGLTTVLRQLDTITISFWYYPKSSGGGAYMFNTGTNNGNGSFCVERYVRGIRIQWKNSSNAYQNIRTDSATGDPDIVFDVLNKWYHICAVLDTTNSSATDKLQIWVNGVRNTSGDKTLTGSGFGTSTSNNVTIGASQTQGNNGGSRMDELAIFNKALTSTEIAALYGGTSPNIYPSNLMATNLNPIAYYPLGEQAQNTGKLPEATANVWQFPNGVLQDYVMDFNGTDYIDLNGSQSTMIGENADFTISVWFNTSTNNFQGVFGSFDTQRFYLAINRGTGKFYMALGGGTNESGVMSFSLHTWHNITVVKNGTSIKYYLNGSLGSTVTHNGGNYGTHTQNLFLGAYNQSGNINHFTGKLSNMAIWNTAITDANQIANIYNNSSPQTTYTVAPQNWWKLNADSVYTPSAPNYTTALGFNNPKTNYDEVAVGDLTTLATPSNDITISLWAKLRTITNPQDKYGMIYSDKSGYIYFSLSGSLIKYESNLRGTTSLKDTTGIAPSELLKWHHIVVTFSGTEAKLYYNSQLLDTGTAGSATNFGEDTIIGNWRNNIGNASYSFGGLISNITVFQSALSASQISTLFNFGTPETNTSFSPIHKWKLDNLTAGLNDTGSLASNNGTARAFSGSGPVQESTSVAVVPSWKIPSALPITTTPNYTTALDFNGTNDQINSGSNLGISGASPRTFSAWIKTTDAGAGYDVIVATGNTGNTGNNFELDYRSNVIMWERWGLGVMGSVIVNDGNWHHACITYDGNILKLYVDGSEDTGGDFPYTIGSTTSTDTPVRIGGMNHSAKYFNGSISNIAIFNSALTSAQVSTIYNGGTPETAISFSPVSWWKLDTGGSTITDSAGSNNGTNSSPGAAQVTSDVLATQPVNGVSTTLPSTALQQSDLQFDSPYSSYSLSFDSGSGTSVDLGSSSIIRPTGDYTFSIWYNLSSSSNAGVFSAGTNINSSGLSLFKGNSGGLELYHKGTNSTSAVVNLGTDSGTNNIWQNAIFTYNDSIREIKGYLNGNLISTVSVAGTGSVDWANNFYLGRLVQSGSYYLNGLLDEFSIFNTPLTSAQVLEIYNNGRPKDLTTFSGTAPISWLRLGENAYFVNNDITLPNSVSGAPNGVSSGTATSMLSADAPGTYANGVGTNLDIVDRVGDAPLSVANSQSYNMIPDDKIPYVPGYVGNQISNTSEMTFDPASNTRFEVAYNTSFGFGTSGFTISLWINFDSLNSTGYNILDFRSSSGGSNVGSLWINSVQGLRWFVSNTYLANLNIPAASFSNLVDWYHICVANSGSTTSFYLNGALIDSASDTTNYAAAPLVIGDYFGGNYVVDGKMDEIAIFNKELTADQIQFDLYKPTSEGTNQTADIANNPNLPTPVAWYRMGD